MNDWLVYFDKRRRSGARSYEDLIATNVSRRQRKEGPPSSSQILTPKGRLVKIDEGTRDILAVSGRDGLFADQSSILNIKKSLIRHLSFIILFFYYSISHDNYLYFKN